MMHIKSVCPECNVTQLIPVKAEDFRNWKLRGFVVQKAFPYLNADQREALISGYCGICWDVMFGFEDFESEFADV